MKSIEIDWVEEWLADQERRAGASHEAVVPQIPATVEKVEEMFDMLDPAKRSDQSPAPVPQAASNDDDVHSFFSEIAAEPKTAAPVAPIAPEALEESSDDALSSVDDLYEAFKRLEQQLDTISESLQTYTQHP